MPLGPDASQTTFARLPSDGGKARIQRKRDNYRMRLSATPIIDTCDDLIMDHADPADLPIGEEA
jgi:hypothetical protein